jgi:hypothetical protein
MHQRAGVKLHHGWMPKCPHGEGFCCATNRMRSRIASPANVAETSSVASPSVLALPQLSCGRAVAPLPFHKSMLTDVGPVELWATRWRRPSAAANPQGFCWPATPPLTHFVTRVILIRLIHWLRLRKIGREEIRRGNRSASGSIPGEAMRLPIQIAAPPGFLFRHQAWVWLSLSSVLVAGADVACSV